MSANRVLRLIEELSFLQIFLGWLVTVLLFGIVYTVGGEAFLVQGKISFLDGLYFSFVTATTLGFGDILPIGFGKFLVVLEANLGLFIYGTLISKLVSVKQETILEEVYNISFEERVNRLRSSFYLIRADINRLTEKIQEGKAKTEDIKESVVYFHSLASLMTDVDQFLHGTKKGRHYVKGVDFFTFELLLNSTIVSLDKVCDFLDLVKKKKFALKRPMLAVPLGRVFSINKKIIAKYSEIDDIRIKNKLFVLESLNKRIKKVIEKEE